VRRSRTAFALGVVGPLLVLGGCSGDDPEPKFAPTETTSPSESGSPSATVTEVALGPVATVRAWVEAQNEAMASGDTTSVRALSAEPCPACDGLIDPIEKVYAAGGYFKTKGWHVNTAKQARSGGSSALVNAAVTIAGGKTVNAAGQEPVVYAVDRNIIRFKLVRDRSQWLVSFIGFV
jgi:hypothetical protein